MSKFLSISEAREQLPTLSRSLARSKNAATITRHGKPVLAILPWSVYEKLYQSLVETLDILSDRDLMKQIRKGREDVRKNRVISHDSIKSSV